VVITTGTSTWDAGTDVTVEGLARRVPSKVLAFAKSPFAQTRHRFLADDRRAPS
jgi:hypothetical protein